MLDPMKDLFGLDLALDEHLKRVDLIGEVPINGEDLELLASRLRDCLRSKKLGPGTGYLEQRGTRVVACFLVHLGVRGYHEGNYWPAVAAALGCDLPPHLQSRWGRMVEQVIKDYHLAPFFDPIEMEGLPYVKPILGHGGIPDYCLGDFFEKLLIPLARRQLAYEGDIQRLLEQWKDRSSDFQTADKPIHRFLRHGGKVAQDFLDRCLNMVDAFETGQADDLDRFGLPVRVIERFQEWFASRNQRLSMRGVRESAGPRYRRPQLYLDPASRGLRLAIPTHSISLEEVEQLRLAVFVRQDNAPVQEFHLRLSSVDGTADTVAMELPLRRSFGRLGVSLRSGYQELRRWDFEGVTEDRPWMAFDGETGEVLTERPLQEHDVWLLSPRTMDLAGGDSLEEVPVWGDLLARRVDLRTSDDWRLRANGDGSNRATYPIEASTGIRPHLEGIPLPAWPNVSCPGCELVFMGAPPDLVFPSRLGKGGWRDATLTVRSLDIGDSAPPDWRRFPLSDLLGGRSGPDQSIRLPLGKPPLSLSTGKFLLNLRVGADLCQTYRIAVVPEMEIECPLTHLHPGVSGEPQPTPIRILVSGTPIESLSEPRGQWEDQEIFRIDLQPHVRCVALKVDGLELHLGLPWLEWAFGADEEGSLHFASQAIEMDLRELERAPEPLLMLRAAPGWEPLIRLVLDGCGQSNRVRWHVGCAIIRLKGYLDSIRAARGPRATLKIVFGESDDERGIEVLQVRRRWGCRLRSTETEVKSGLRALFFAWDDQVVLPDRVIRLWRSADRVDHPAVERFVEDGAEELGFDEPAEVLPDGRYLLEFDTHGDDGWSIRDRPDYFKEGVQVIRLGASSVERLGSPAKRLDEMLGALECAKPPDPALKSRFVDDILAEPVSAQRALCDRGWVGLKTLFKEESSATNGLGEIENIYGAISWSDSHFVVMFLRGLNHEAKSLTCPEGRVLDINHKAGAEYPLVFPLYGSRAKTKSAKTSSWHQVSPTDWTPEVERFVVSRFQMALRLGIASCPGDVQARIEQMGRKAFLSDPDGYLKALIEAEQELSQQISRST